MTPRSTLVAVGLLLSLAACGRPESNNQADETNVAAPESRGTAEEMNAANAPATAGSNTSGVSTGMPVPGTNTPEHIVINEDTSQNNTNGG